MTTATKSTHVLAPAEQCRRLRLLASVTRITQSEYLREVARHVIETYGESDTQRFPAEDTGTEKLESIVFRLPDADLEALKALSARTRVRRSEYLRVGLASVLEKYAPVIERAEREAA